MLTFPHPPIFFFLPLTEAFVPTFFVGAAVFVRTCERDRACVPPLLTLFPALKHLTARD